MTRLLADELATQEKRRKANHQVVRTSSIRFNLADVGGSADELLVAVQTIAQPVRGGQELVNNPVEIAAPAPVTSCKINIGNSLHCFWPPS